MKFHSFPQGTTLYRASQPRWAYLPLSGEGAAISGGRFNEQGVQALYLSLEPETSIAEYKQDARHLPLARLSRMRLICPSLLTFAS